MSSARINWTAIIVLVIFYQVFSAAWYWGFEVPWTDAVGVDEYTMKNFSPVNYVIPMAGALLTTWFMAIIFDHLGVRTASEGFRWGLLLWACILLPSLATHYAFSFRPATLLIIDAGQELFALMIAGAVLGGWRPKGEQAHEIEAPAVSAAT